MKTIAFLGYHTDQNLGDPLICQVVETLFKERLSEDTDWRFFQLRNHFEGLAKTKKNKLVEKLAVFFRKVGHYVPWSIWDKIRIQLVSWGYRSRLRDVDWGVVAGGGIIHYRFHESWLGVCAFIKACNCERIPVVLNAVGVEGFDSGNYKCKLLSHYLCYPNVKYISTRDDIETLKLYTKSSHRIKISRVIDPAIFCSDIFTIKKDTSSKTIGIGLIRSNIFNDYHTHYDGQQLANYYRDVCLEVQKRNLDWEFFTNGNPEDLSIVPEIERLLGEKITVKTPSSVTELISIIASYKGIVSARMHSCIVAYSLDVPAVAFVWNEKIAFWGRNIQKEDNYINMEKLSAALAVETLFRDFGDEYNPVLRKQWEKGYLDSVDQAISVLLSNSK